MEDELHKRFTDCVYFLASPLTCKKGSECEYRHNEIARLNPRDCWFWLNGNCLNPTCAFRHPPLDGWSETSSDSVQLPPKPSVPVTKTNVPCYFYYNGFCNKGDLCPFLHGPNGVTPALKTSKTASTGTDAHVLENKTSTRTDTGTGLVGEPSNPSENKSKAVILHFQTKDVLSPLASNEAAEGSPSPQISNPECEEADIKLSDTPLPIVDFTDSRSPLCPDQSSEEHLDNHIEPEEWWEESSPGFDVLVDDGLEQSGYEDDTEYLLVHDRESGMGLNDHLLQYDYEDLVGHDNMDYPDARILYEHGIYDPYDCVENDYISDSVPKIPEHSRERMLEPMLFRKRKLLHRAREVDDQNALDLRDHLRKCRRIDGHQVARNPRKRHSSHMNSKSRDRPVRHRTMGRPSNGRLASEAARNTIGSHSDTETRSNENNRRGWSRHLKSRQNESRKHVKERRRQVKPPAVSSEISRGRAAKEAKQTWECTGFTGPKTLAQIKEEKRRVRVDEDGFGNTGSAIPHHPRRTTSEDFRGPKPLSEILKEKGRLVSVVSRDTAAKLNSSYLECEHVEPPFSYSGRNNGLLDEDLEVGYRRTDKKFSENENDFVNDDDYSDDDEDGLAKKLANIIS